MILDKLKKIMKQTMGSETNGTKLSTLCEVVSSTGIDLTPSFSSMILMKNFRKEGKLIWSERQKLILRCFDNPGPGEG